MSSPGVMRPRVIKMLSFLLRLWLPSHCKEPEYGWKCLLPSAPACLLHLEERYSVALGDWLLHHFLLQISAMIFSLKFTLLWPCFLGLLLPMNSLANKQKANKQNAETLEIFTVQRETGTASVWCPISPPCPPVAYCHLVVLLNVVFRTWRKIPHFCRVQFTQWGCSSQCSVISGPAHPCSKDSVAQPLCQRFSLLPYLHFTLYPPKSHYLSICETQRMLSQALSPHRFPQIGPPAQLLKMIGTIALRGLSQSTWPVTQCTINWVT